MEWGRNEKVLPFWNAQYHAIKRSIMAWPGIDWNPDGPYCLTYQKLRYYEDAFEAAGITGDSVWFGYATLQTDLPAGPRDGGILFQESWFPIPMKREVFICRQKDEWWYCGSYIFELIGPFDAESWKEQPKEVSKIDGMIFTHYT